MKLIQNLGLSSSTPKTESRFKNLFWPTIRHEGDVDVIAQQGLWVCFVVAVFTLALGALQRVFVLGSLESGFFFLGGIGARQRSRFAAIAVFSTYLLSTIVLLPLSNTNRGPALQVRATRSGIKT